MSEEIKHMSYGEFQDLAAGINVSALLEVIADIKAGKKYTVEHEGILSHIILDKDGENITLDR